ncbi:chromate transporter [Acinetobacter sp. SFB]|uniref:chromate efflux transporter n=1 Tax=Acinetobacter sp. SFB TaxID=1805634 RepID=UPI0007D7DF8B|nr:chromate efflux transporter [Acinetobacter sp. SFB]OAL78615.1 chromate transporter [Acinetobacter sp. SFB]
MPSLHYRTIFLTFLKLGCLAFGGPAAHLVFFHHTFVKQLNWLDDQQYAQLLALAQILPGPTSSQVGLAIGYVKKGYWGAVLAWLGFTLPSAILMTMVAVLGQQLFPLLSSEFFHSIQLIVLAVVAWAFWQMLGNFCTRLWQYILMLGSTLFIYTVPLPMNQIIVIFIAALVGIYLSPRLSKIKENKTEKNSFKIAIFSPQRSHAYLWLILFILPFFIFLVLNWQQSSILLQTVESFYRSASLVFGGGHIVLPFLHQDFVATGLIPAEKFDLGYAFAQLMPGPLFSFASYVGALLTLTPYPILNACIATLAIFLPSFFLVFGTLPYWSWLMNQADIRHAVVGINAAVVGLLLCMVIQMAQHYIVNITDLIFIAVVIALLKTKLPVWLSLIGSFMTYQLILAFYNVQ